MEEKRVDTEHREHYERESEEEYVAPGVPIVRNSTPKPLSFRLLESNTGQSESVQALERETVSAFPIKAPSAPPLPEECEEMPTDTDTGQTVKTIAVGATPLPLSAQMVPADDTSSEFLWLFEYALEMDSSLLNSADRLDGLALLYGPAVLKGYEMTFDVVRSTNGKVVATIVPGRKREAAVWGMLYRVPRRLAERTDGQPAVLDKIHAAAPPDGLFERAQVVVHEVLRARDVTCVTYIASARARNTFHLLPRAKQCVDVSYAQHLLETARKQQLPEDYISELAALTISTQEIAPLSSGGTVEQNTEPLPVLTAEKRSLNRTESKQGEPEKPLKTRNTGMVVFTLYLILTLMAVFMLAVLQGLHVGRDMLPTNLTFLRVPWFVLAYGLVGGCLSCLVTLGRLRPLALPDFVLITWFARPYVGAILAVLMYLLLNSDLLHVAGSPEQQRMLFSLLAVLTGFGERWLFYRRM